MRCPHCNARDLSRSQRSAWQRALGHVWPFRPYRCKSCGDRSWLRIRWSDERTPFFTSGAAALLILIGCLTLLWPDAPAPRPAAGPSAAIGDIATDDASPDGGGGQPVTPDSRGDLRPRDAHADAATAEDADTPTPTEMAEAEPEREPEPTAPDATGYRETTDRVHMRRGPGSEHASITILDRGRIVPVLEPPRGDWVHVRHFDADGWVHGTFLRPAAPPADG